MSFDWFRLNGKSMTPFGAFLVESCTESTQFRTSLTTLKTLRDTQFILF